MTAINRFARDMNGIAMHIGDKTVCLTLPSGERCLAMITAIGDDGSITVCNGRVTKTVSPESCIAFRT